jgi:hypothetical protein
MQYLSGSGGELRACVGLARFAGIGRLFDETQIEMIGVQNFGNGGSSGGPLISASDDLGAFMGIGNQRSFSTYRSYGERDARF